MKQRIRFEKVVLEALAVLLSASTFVNNKIQAKEEA